MHKLPIENAIDTMAAGDSFIAGFLFYLSNQSRRAQLADVIVNREKVLQAVLLGAKCGAFTCQPLLSSRFGKETTVNE